MSNSAIDLGLEDLVVHMDAESAKLDTDGWPELQ
jgi:hypothetical protein